MSYGCLSAILATIIASWRSLGQIAIGKTMGKDSTICFVNVSNHNPSKRNIADTDFVIHSFIIFCV